MPIAVFFFPEPPTTPPISEPFRTLPDVEFASIPREVRLLMRKAKAFQLNLSELAPRGRNPAAQLITRELSRAPPWRLAPEASSKPLANLAATRMKRPSTRS